MLRAAMSVSAVLVGCATAGCTATPPNYEVYKCGLPYDKVIANPYEWTLMQFANGPISGPEAGDYARSVIAAGLEQAIADVDGNYSQELLLRSGGGDGGLWDALVFEPAKGGYRYVGTIPATFLVVQPQTALGTVLVYQRCGGHAGYIVTYKKNGARFECISSEELSVGDGAPAENNLRVEKLFSIGRRLHWIPVHNMMIGRHVQAPPDRPSFMQIAQNGYPTIEEAAIGAWELNDPDEPSENYGGPAIGYFDGAATLKLWRSKPDILEMEKVDLNGDGIGEVLLHNGDYVDMAGKEKSADSGQGANCSWAVLQKVLGSWRVVGSGWGRRPRVQEQATNGWKDLMGGYHNSVAQGSNRLYQFDGTLYKLTKESEYDHSGGESSIRGSEVINPQK